MTHPSVIPVASFDNVFPVQGAMIRTSMAFAGPNGSAETGIFPKPSGAEGEDSVPLGTAVQVAEVTHNLYGAILVNVNHTDQLHQQAARQAPDIFVL